LDLAVSRGIHIINVDNLAEPEIIQRLAERHGRTQRVGVRVITSVGWSSQFGLSIRHGIARVAFERIRTLDRLVPVGLHIHLGTGIRSIGIYLQAVREMLAFAEELRRDLGIAINFLDLGGGFGVPTVRPFSRWDMRLMANDHAPTVMELGKAAPLEEYARGIAGILDTLHGPGGSEKRTLFYEPGRAITSSAQSLLVRVLAVKGGGPRGSSNVILDGGKNIAMPMGYEYHEIFAAGKLREPASHVYNLFGPLCHPADVLSRMKTLPRLEPRDILAIMDAGAYFIPNQMNFSNPRPAAVMVEHGTAWIIRDRELFEDIVALDRFNQPELSSDGVQSHERTHAVATERSLQE
jgi:diaminopimelate decarboxylase